jgi:hypothetical protein
MATKTPTASGISRLLSAAGFKRSEQLPGYGGSGTGYRVTGTPGSGIVAVKHHFWSMSGRQDPGPCLAKYAEAITAAGWNVEVGERALIVTAKEGD